MSTSTPPSASAQRSASELEAEIERAEAKLANEGFVAKAPPAGRRRPSATSSSGCRPSWRRCERRRWTVEEAERYLLSLELFGMRFGLDRMRRLMTALGHPERAFDSIHVVGTNGKSSTTRMIAAILARHGLRTGAYLSPHLVSFDERIRIDDADLEPAAFAGAVAAGGARGRARRTARCAGDDRVTQFEVLTAAAYSELAARASRWP